MIKNYFISPHPFLSDFIDDYILSTSHNQVITVRSYWPASNETSLIFNLADLPEHHGNGYTASLMSDKRQCVIGLLTHCNGLVHFTGAYHTFIIQFKANGFNKLFRMAGSEITDQIIAAGDIFGKQTNQLYEQLVNASGIQQMACMADSFLLYYLNRLKKTGHLHDGITAISSKLFNTTELLSVSQYAYNANMSIRNFERRFTEQVGVSPKFYIRLVRFNEAVKNKMAHPAKNWTAIAHECGYYDQMHMIKDFRQFANSNPSGLFSHHPDTTSTGINRATPLLSSSDQPDNQLPDSQIEYVKRTQF